MPALPLANWNGTQMPLRDVRVSVLDRAFLFGDAIYEVLRVRGGRPFLQSEHIKRLQRNLHKLDIVCDVERLERRMIETLTASGLSEAVIYIQVTRGEASRTHRYPDPPAMPNELIYVASFDNNQLNEQRQTGVAVITSPDMRWKRCDIKSVNLLANCMAADHAARSDCIEAILVNDAGVMVEGTHTSLFGVRDGTIITAPLGENILPGITRGLLVELASQAGLPLEDGHLRRDAINAIDELFLTGTTVDILPIVRVDDVTIGNGQPGPVTSTLIETFTRYVT